MKMRNMKSTHQFRDQVNVVTNWFKTWNECEQTVALYSLLKKVSATQARFLRQVLTQSVADCNDVESLEVQANNPAFISSLCSETKEHAVKQLLLHLPLLQPGNLDAKTEYLNIIPKVLAHSIDNGIHIEESRQLLSYSLIHPAIGSEERSQFTLWLGHLEEQCSYNIYQEQARLADNPMALQDHLPDRDDYHQGGYLTAIQQQQQQQHVALSLNRGMNGCHQTPMRDAIITNDPMASMGSQSSIGKNMGQGRPITACASNGNMLPGGGLTNLHSCDGLMASSHGSLSTVQGLPPNPHRKLTRSASVTPPISVPTSVSEWLNAQDDMMLRSTHQSIVREPIHHAPLSPQSSVTSSGSGSDTPHDPDQHHRNSFLEDSSGMKDVPVWLKSLRLHKYAYLFQQLSYDEMMTLTETWLETQNVTKGARHKIILSIHKLRDRQNVLKAMEKEVMETGNIKQALTEIKAMMNMPLKSYCPDQNKTDGSSESQLGNKGEEKGEGKENNGPPASSVDSDSITDGDLPGQICRVLGKICTQLLVSNRLEDECFAMYIQLLDKCLLHEAFNPKQKKLMLSWKQQVHKIWHPVPQKFALEKQRRTFGTYPMGNIANIVRQRPVRGQVLKPGQPAPWTFSKRPPMIPTVSNPAQLPLYRNNSINAAFSARPQVYEVKQAVQRTHSAPIKSSQFSIGAPMPRPVSDVSATEPEINARLDSLCLSMTEHALGGFSDWSSANYNDPDRGSTF